MNEILFHHSNQSAISAPRRQVIETTKVANPVESERSAVTRSSRNISLAQAERFLRSKVCDSLSTFPQSGV